LAQTIQVLILLYTETGAFSLILILLSLWVNNQILSILFYFCFFLYRRFFAFFFLIILVLTQPSYPARLSEKFLEDLVDVFYKCCPQFQNNPFESEFNEKDVNKQELFLLCEKYNDPVQVDKIIQAQHGVNRVAEVMQNNVKKMLVNQDQMVVSNQFLLYELILRF
jgi:hypothetical protein